VTVVSSVTPSSAKSVQLQPYVNPGVAAISALNKTNGLLDQDMVAHYLESPNTVLAPTLVGEPSPSIQEITITDMSNLVHTQHIVVPGVQNAQQVFYVVQKGSFNLAHQLPLSLLNTLIPSQANLPVLSQLLFLDKLPGLETQAGLLPKQVTNTNVTGFDPFNLTKTVPITIYEVFNANTGNLLAWG
jgi:hypothetical protein